MEPFLKLREIYFDIEGEDADSIEKRLAYTKAWCKIMNHATNKLYCNPQIQHELRDQLHKFLTASKKVSEFTSN